jgi:hypothetical protein
VFSKSETAEAVAGVSATLPGKIWDAFGTTTRFATNIYADTEFLSVDTAMQFVSDLGNAANSWSNANKAVLMASQGETIDKMGKVTIKEKFSIGTIAAQAMGFAPSSKTILFEKKLRLQGLANYKKQVIQTLTKNYADMVRANTGDGSPKAIKEVTDRYLRIHQGLIRSVNDPAVRAEIIDSWRENVLLGKSKDEIISRRYLMNGGAEIEAGVLNGAEAQLKNRLIVK